MSKYKVIQEDDIWRVYAEGNTTSIKHFHNITEANAFVQYLERFEPPPAEQQFLSE